MSASVQAATPQDNTARHMTPTDITWLANSLGDKVVSEKLRALRLEMCELGEAGGEAIGEAMLVRYICTCLVLHACTLTNTSTKYDSIRLGWL
jgi:hypothetical protein